MSARPAPAASREPRLFLAACVAAAFLFQGVRPLYETDEGRYAECARTMLATGDWLVPRLGGAEHLTKPPGTYWAIAAGTAVLGDTALAARALLGVAFALSALSMRRIGTSLLGPPAGARAGWMWLSMLYPFVCGSVLTTDAFHASATLGAIAFALTAGESRRPEVKHLLSGLCLAAASMCKGPVAWLPFAGFAAGWALFGRRARPGRPIVSATGVLVAVVLGIGWFVWAIWIEHVPGAAERYLKTESVERLTTAGDHDPHWFGWFVPILLVGTLPWTVGVVRGIRRAWSGDVGKWLAVWAAVPFLVHSAVPAKNWLYVVGVCAPLVLLAANAATDARRESPWPGRPAAVLAWLSLLLAFRAVPAFLPTPKDMRSLDQAVDRAADSIAAAAQTDSGTRELPVAILTGRDLWGLYFYRGGAVTHVETASVRSPHATTSLRGFAKSASSPWILVAESGRHEDEAVRSLLGPSARLFETGGVTRYGPHGAEPLADDGNWRVWIVDPRGDRR